MNSKAKILRSIRLALSHQASNRGGHPAAKQAAWAPDPASAPSLAALSEKFKIELELAGGEWISGADQTAVIDRLCAMIRACAFTQIAISGHAVCQEMELSRKLSLAFPDIFFTLEKIQTENAFDRQQLKQQLSNVQMSITGADYLIAETGTVALQAGPTASRAISLLPEVHVVLAKACQILPNLPALLDDLKRKYGGNFPTSAFTLITGPSRTADIEKTLIKGVHGPHRLIVFLS
jgi:L-lactate utilization protein LutC